MQVGRHTTIAVDSIAMAIGSVRGAIDTIGLDLICCRTHVERREGSYEGEVWDE